MKVRDPFEGHHDVLCIETGEIGDEKVNVFNSGEIGSTIIKKMVGEPMLTNSFTRKDMAVTMRPPSTVICDGERVSMKYTTYFCVQNDHFKQMGQAE